MSRGHIWPHATRPIPQFESWLHRARRVSEKPTTDDDDVKPTSASERQAGAIDGLDLLGNGSESIDVGWTWTYSIRSAALIERRASNFPTTTDDDDRCLPDSPSAFGRSTSPHPHIPCTYLPTHPHPQSQHATRTGNRGPAMKVASASAAAGVAAAQSALLAAAATAAGGGVGSKASKQREKRLTEALVELRQALRAGLSLPAAVPAPAAAAGAAAAAAAGVAVPRSVLAAVVQACLLGAVVGGGEAAAAAAPVPPSVSVRVLAYQVCMTLHVILDVSTAPPQHKPPIQPNPYTPHTTPYHATPPQTLLAAGPALRAHAHADAAFMDALKRAALADVAAAGEGTAGESSSSEAAMHHHHKGGWVEDGEETAAALVMDGDVTVLALRVLLVAAPTEGRLVVLVRCVLLVSSVGVF